MLCFSVRISPEFYAPLLLCVPTFWYPLVGKTLMVLMLYPSVDVFGSSVRTLPSA